MASAQKITQKDDIFYSELKHEFTVQPGGKLEIVKISGNVTLTSWNKNVVQINEKLKMDVFTKEEAEKILERTKSQYSQRGDYITVRGSGGKRRIQRNFDIFVPERFNIKIQTGSGNISAGKITGEVNLQTSGGNIETVHINGPVVVNTSGGNLLLENISGSLDAKTSGGNIELENLGGSAVIKTSGGNISLHHAEKAVILKTSGGNIDISNVKGNLVAKTSGGRIKIRDCHGDAEVHTSGGDIRLHNLSGRIDAHTSGGDIRGEQFHNNIDVHTSGGDIEFKDVQAGIEARTSGGDLTIEITLTDFTKPHPINLRTSAGNITLTLPAKIPGSIFAEIHLGKRERYWKRYDIYSDFPLSKNVIKENGNRILRSSGGINGGGDEIKLQTSAGDIHIRKSK